MLKVNDLITELELEPILLADGEREITGGYAGDLLSWVMGRANAGDAWVTIMSNMNVAAVAQLADVACVVFAEGVVPVMAPLTHDGNGNLLNTNADTIAGETAKALAPYFDVTLVYCFEKAGVLLDENDDTSVIPNIDRASFERFVEQGVISGGMIPKIQNSLSACWAGVKEVVITNASGIGLPGGTVITI